MFFIGEKILLKNMVILLNFILLMYGKCFYECLSLMFYSNVVSFFVSFVV